MRDSHRQVIFALAFAVLLIASVPILYPLAVAAAACCERRLPREDARVAGLAIMLAIFAGTTATQLGILPLAGPQRADGGSAWSGPPIWGLALASAVGVWAVVARIGCWQDQEIGSASGCESSHRASSDRAQRGVDSEPCGDRRLSPGTSDANTAIGTALARAGPDAAIEIDSGQSGFQWDHPTPMSVPSKQDHVSHLSYDVDAAKVLGAWLKRTPLETFRNALLAADLSTIDAATVSALPGDSTAEFAQRLIAQGKITPYQAVLICAEWSNLLKIDEFEVLDRLGRGGMAIVLRVRHTLTGHLYALKLLEERDPADSVSRKRFLREMEAVCDLAHPNIAVARSVGQQGNRLHIAMELVEGQNLAELVAKQGPLPPGRALAFVGQAARALAHAHNRGLVHRDVKPGNLMVGPGEQIKLVDMGLARFIDAIESQPASAANAWHTLTGHLIGTIDYMAPEQAEEFTDSDCRSDIYSLGCTLFFLLTGESHLRGRTQRRRAISLVSRQGITELRALRQDLPECLYDLVSRMTQLEPEARFQSMREVIDAIDRCGQELGVITPSDRHFRVLMVEDSLTQSIATRQKLEVTSPHVEVHAVTSLADAIAACQHDRFDIVLLDLNLPDSSAVGTVKRFRAADAVTPILVMTSSNDPELGLACITAGADDFLPKQEIEPRMLQRHILLTIGRQRSGMALSDDSR